MECPFYPDGKHRWVPNPDEEGLDGDGSDICDACGVGRC
jgi:hypothetical protein